MRFVALRRGRARAGRSVLAAALAAAGLGTLVVTVGPFVAAQPPGAAAAPLVALEVSAERLAPEAAEDGRETLVYTIAFTNTTDDALDAVRITQAIPPGVVYVPGTAVAPGAAVLFSADGGATFGLPSELSVAAGAGERRRAEPADYTHIRWLLAAPLDAHATGFARFRAELR